MIEIKKLKIGDHIQFAENTWAIVTNYEENISNLKGVIEEIDFSDSIWIKLDKPNKHFKDYDNCVQFGLVEGSSGSDKSYLKNASIIEEK